MVRDRSHEILNTNPKPFLEMNLISIRSISISSYFIVNCLKMYMLIECEAILPHPEPSKCQYSLLKCPICDGSMGYIQLRNVLSLLIRRKHSIEYIYCLISIRWNQFRFAINSFSHK